MSLLRRFLRPPNALILAYDHLEQEDAEAMEEQLKEVGRYYQFAKLSQVVEARRKGKALGMAAVVFKHARKSLIVRGLARTRNEGIPITVFVDADRVGTNRLPLDEELEIYDGHYPGKIPATEKARLLAACWTKPEEVETFLKRCRTEIGPLPLNELNPTRYFATWGNLTEVPPDLFECGLSITSDLAAVDVAAQLTFVRQRAKAPVTLSYSPRVLERAEATLAPLGVEALLGPTKGAVDKSTSLWALPQWDFSR